MMKIQMNKTSESSEQIMEILNSHTKTLKEIQQHLADLEKLFNERDDDRIFPSHIN